MSNLLKLLIRWAFSGRVRVYWNSEVQTLQTSRRVSAWEMAYTSGDVMSKHVYQLKQEMLDSLIRENAITIRTMPDPYDMSEVVSARIEYIKSNA